MSKSEMIRRRELSNLDAGALRQVAAQTANPIVAKAALKAAHDRELLALGGDASVVALFQS